jgi:hypothetical protein
MSANITETESTPSLSQSENRHVLRNDILLPKSLFSCTVICEEGMWICSELTLVPRTSPSTGLMPQPMRHSIPSL